MAAHRNYVALSAILIVSLTCLTVYKANFLFKQLGTPLEDTEVLRNNDLETRRVLVRQYFNRINLLRKSDISIDLLSIGSSSRYELIRAQRRVMSKHPSVRHSWWLTEIDDDDRRCGVNLDMEDYLSKCTNREVDPWKGGDRDNFVSEREGALHWDEERLAKNHIFANNVTGWICAQKRVGFAIGKIIAQYKGDFSDLPDFLIVMDDDTYLNLNLLAENLKAKNPNVAHIYAGHVFPIKHFQFAWGGYSVIIPRGSLVRFKQPLYCEDGKYYTDAVEKKACGAIWENIIGEKEFYKPGMSVSELAYALSARKYFCMHSDHLIGYLINHYWLSSPTKFSEPGALYDYDGQVAMERECSVTDHICHHMRLENFTRMVAIRRIK